VCVAYDRSRTTTTSARCSKQTTPKRSPAAARSSKLASDCAQSLSDSATKRGLATHLLRSGSLYLWYLWPPDIVKAGRTGHSVLLLMFISFLYFFISFFNRQRVTILCHNVPRRARFMNKSQKFGAPSQKIWLNQNTKFSTWFQTTSRFDRECIWNATRYRQSENGIANYEHSAHTCS